MLQAISINAELRISTYVLVSLFTFAICGIGLFFTKTKTKNGLTFVDILFDVILLYVCARVFARIFFMLMHRNDPLYADSIHRFFAVGLSGHGAMFGGFLGMFLISKMHKANFPQISDWMAPFAALTYSLMRVGCFLAGCCRGTETQSILGVAFPDEMSPLIFRHPVQLYDSFLNMMLFLFLLEFSQKKKYACLRAVTHRQDGQVFLMFLLINSAIRFLMEYFRWGVSAQVMFGFITQAQLASLCIIAASLYFMRKFSVQSLNERVVSV